MRPQPLTKASFCHRVAKARLIFGKITACVLHVSRLAALLASVTLLDQAACAQPASNDATLLNRWLWKEYPETQDWDFGGQLRLRYDVRSDAGSFPNRDFIRTGQDNDNDYLLFQEKFHIGYRQDWFSLFVEARDSSTTGDDRNPNPEADQFDLHQAYLSVGNPKQFPLMLKVGRQQMSYGDERFVEKGDWGNLNRTFDAAKLRFENDALWVDAFASHPIIPNNGTFNEGNGYDLFSGVYASTRTLIPKQETDLFVFSHNVSAASATIVNTAGTGPTARDVYTVGARMKSLPGRFGGWDYSTEVALQLGSVNLGGRRLRQEAFAADIQGGHTWTNASGSPRVGVGYTFGSGDSNPNDGKNGTFDLLFGAIHRYYGMTDVTGIRNLHSPSISFSLKPARGLVMKLEFFSYWLAETGDFFYAEVGKGRSGNGYGLNPQFSSFIGNEVDLSANYAVTSYLTVQTGYGHFFPGSYIRQSVDSVAANGGVVDADYVYVMTIFKF